MIHGLFKLPAYKDLEKINISHFPYKKCRSLEIAIIRNSYQLFRHHELLNKIYLTTSVDAFYVKEQPEKRFKIFNVPTLPFSARRINSTTFFITFNRKAKETLVDSGPYGTIKRGLNVTVSS